MCSKARGLGGNKTKTGCQGGWAWPRWLTVPQPSQSLSARSFCWELALVRPQGCFLLTEEVMCVPSSPGLELRSRFAFSPLPPHLPAACSLLRPRGGWQSHRGAGAYIPESLSGEELPTTWTSTCVKINIPCVGAPRFLGLGAVSSPVIKDFLSSQAPVMLLWLKARQRNYLAKGIHPHDPRPPKVRKAGALQSVSLLALL